VSKPLKSRTSWLFERLLQSKTKKGKKCIFFSDYNIRFHATLGWPASPSSIQGHPLLRPAMTHLAPTQNSNKGVLIHNQSGIQLIVKSIGSLLANKCKLG